MKILIAVSSREYSEPTLRVGMKVAQAFQASTTVVDVGEKISAFNTNAVNLAQERMESWNFYRPGINVLEWAFQYLAENHFIEPQYIQAGFPTKTLIEKGAARSEVFLEGTICEDVNLILRNGDIIAELRDEVQTGNFDVTIIGGSRKRKMAHDLVQYIDSSILVVNQYNHDQEYKVLLAVDDSPGTWKAVKYGARVARSFNISIDIITVSKKEYFGDGYRGAAEKAAKYLQRAGIAYQNHFETGAPAEVILKKAGNNHIIVMGASTQSPLIKFFKGSKPLSVLEGCNCPILVVK